MDQAREDRLSEPALSQPPNVFWAQTYLLNQADCRVLIADDDVCLLRIEERVARPLALVAPVIRPRELGKEALRRSGAPFQAEMRVH